MYVKNEGNKMKKTEKNRKINDLWQIIWET